ncbi:MAG: hypothetical protein IJS45_10450 [Clostridia bacterium]|nr:hypothetical protein [Clostridia bacterium]
MKKALCLALAFILLILSSCGSIIEKAEFTRGKTENNVYECGMLNIKFVPGPAWVFGEDEYILLQSGVDPDTLRDADSVADQLNNLSTVYDMTAEDESAGISVAVSFYNLSLYVGGRDTTEEEYAEQLKLELAETFSDYNAEISDGGVKTIAGYDFKRIVVNLRIGDSDVEQCYYIKKLDGFMMSVSFTAAANDGTEDMILEMFSKTGA